VEIAQSIVESLSTHVTEYLRGRRKKRHRHTIQITASQLNACSFTKNTSSDQSIIHSINQTLGSVISLFHCCMVPSLLIFCYFELNINKVCREGVKTLGMRQLGETKSAECETWHSDD